MLSWIALLLLAVRQAVLVRVLPLVDLVVDLAEDVREVGGVGDMEVLAAGARRRSTAAAARRCRPSPIV